MEETNQCMENHESGFLTLLKETLRVPSRYTRFTIFILIASLPLLFLMVAFETLLEPTLKESLKIHSPRSFYQNNWRYKEYWWPVPHFSALEESSLTSEVLRSLFIYLPLIYLFPLHILHFLAGFVIIVSVSKLQKDDHTSSTFRIKERLQGSFVTSLYALFLSTCLSLGFIWLLLGCVGYYLLFAVIHLFILLALLPKYLELTAVWNLSLVVSALEKVQGINALSFSFHLCERNKMLGRYLMMAFFLWSLAIRSTSLLFKEFVEIGVVGRSSLLWLGDLMKWVVCVLYYYHCKGKGLRNRMDEEVGKLSSKDGKQPN